MNSTRLNGRVANYIEQGNGPPVVLIHGIASSFQNWRYLLPFLASHGFHLYALDLLGHGESPRLENGDGYHINRFTQHLAEWIDSLELDQPLVVIGHSLGGYLALTYAALVPEKVRALVLVNPLLGPHQLAPHLKLSLQRPRLGEKMLRLTPLWMVRWALKFAFTTASHLPSEVRNQVARDFKRTDPSVFQIPKTIRDLRPDLPDIQQPALTTWGDRDLTLDPYSFPRLHNSLPNSKALRFHGAGHTPHLTQAPRFNQRVLRFLHSLPA